MIGKLQIYTGNGKGKTTSALGLTLRACGAGLRVYFGQFIKAGEMSEIKALKKFLPQVKVEQYGLGRFIQGTPSDSDIHAAKQGLDKLHEAMLSKQYDIIIADEANGAVSANLISEKDLLSLISQRPDSVELIITGRNALPSVIDKADLVTEMKEVKHYFADGTLARKGIEM